MKAYRWTYGAIKPHRSLNYGRLTVLNTLALSPIVWVADRAINTLTFYVTFWYIYHMQMKLELVAVPVSDVDRAKAFYTEKIGFHADHDYQVRDDLRFVQLTPPGSACSIVIGVGITDMQPGSQKGLQMVVADVQEVRDELVKRGVAVSEIEVMPWGSFVFFSDPDGNGWSLQQLPVRQ
jgi:catechol 2,3-dioxygenase-like lactoylglutathione lyase family enzyme